MFISDPVDSLSKEKGNFLRYYLLCQTIATESVRLYFTRKVPEPTLSSHLNSYKTNIKFSHWKCTNDQITILFPGRFNSIKLSDFEEIVSLKNTKLTQHNLTYKCP